MLGLQREVVESIHSLFAFLDTLLPKGKTPMSVGRRETLSAL